MPTPTDILTSLEDISRIRNGLEAVSDQLSHSGPIMAMLGPFMFSLDTAAYQKFRRVTQFDWPKQEIANGRPSRQWMGPGDDVIELDGVIYPEYAGGLKQIDGMRELAGLGKPMILVDGLGDLYGTFVVEEIEETLRVFYSNGQPRKIGFRLRLARREPQKSLGAMLQQRFEQLTK